MIRLFFISFIAALLSAPALARGQSATPEPASTIQANTNLIVVDVVVTDSRRNPIHNLTKSDFKVLENGLPQSIDSFEEHHAWEAAAPLPPAPEVPAGTFTNYTNAPSSGALNILLLDSLNTPMSAQANVRSQMLNYLKEARPGTRMAIFGLTSRLILLQGFTSDPELLCDVLNGKEGLPKASVAMTGQVDGDSPGADNPVIEMSQDVAEAMGNNPGAEQLVANLQQFQAESQTFLLQTRARLTLDALNQLARSLGALPGRKNLIWFSGAFPINILPDGDLQNPFGAVASAQDEFRETSNLLARSQVAVYPIDARGPMVTPMLNAGNSGAEYTRTPNAFAKDQATVFGQNADEHGTMQAMAEATGGQVFVNTNGLKQAVEKAIDTGSNYYTLAYSPTNQQWKGEYRKIQVEVARPGLTLAYRRSYFDDDPNAPAHHGEPAATTGGPPPYSAMRAAMMPGGPDPTEIIFTAFVVPTSAQPEPDPAPGNKPAEKTTGPYRRYAVQLGIRARDFECATTPEGVYQCKLDVAIIVYDGDGMALNSAGGAVQASIPVGQFGAVLRSGLSFRQDISVPVGGESFLRIGVRDQATDKIGAVEIPVTAVSKLPPLTTPAQGKEQPESQN